MFIFNANCFAAMTVAQARALGDGVPVEIGPVYITSTNNFSSEPYYGCFAQDETGGILLFSDPATPLIDLINNNNLVPGSCVTFSGNNIIYFGYHEIGDISVVNNYGVSNVPAAVLIDIDTLASPTNSAFFPLEGKLITISGVDFQESGTFAGKSTYNIWKNGTQGFVRIQYENDPLVGGIIPMGTNITITGFLAKYHADYQIFPLEITGGVTRDPYLYREPYPDLNFGVVYPNFDRTLQITIKNGGESVPLNISSFSATSGDTANFSPTSIPDFSIPPQSSTNIYFVYTPGSSVGVSNGVLYEFQSNDISNNNNKIEMVGFSSATPLPTPAVWINEVGVNDPGNDDEEFIELCGIAGTDITGWKIILYNGYGNHTNYDEHIIGSTLPGSSFTFVLPDDQDGFGFYVLETADSSVPNSDEIAGFDDIQNSENAAVRLSTSGNVSQVHLFAYDCQSAKTYFPDLIPNDLTPLADNAGQSNSLSYVGTGLEQPDFIWDVITHTPGELNGNQVLPEPGLLIAGIAFILLSFRRK